MFDEKKSLANVISQLQKDSSLQLIQNDNMKNSKGRSEAVIHIPKVATNTQTKQSQIQCCVFPSTETKHNHKVLNQTLRLCFTSENMTKYSAYRHKSFSFGTCLSRVEAYMYIQSGQEVTNKFTCQQLKIFFCSFV